MSLPYILTPEAKVPAADRLRAMFNDDKVRIVPELADCMGAKAAEMNGFEVIMVSSGDLACAMTGIPRSAAALHRRFRPRDRADHPHDPDAPDYRCR